MWYQKCNAGVIFNIFQLYAIFGGIEGGFLILVFVVYQAIISAWLVKRRLHSYRLARLLPQAER